MISKSVIIPKQYKYILIPTATKANKQNLNKTNKSHLEKQISVMPITESNITIPIREFQEHYKDIFTANPPHKVCLMACVDDKQTQ